MASLTKKTTNKRRRRQRKAGRTRKNLHAKHSTPTTEELFAACGQPGEPAPTPQN